MAMEIRAAESDADFAGFAALVTEYIGWSRERYRAHAWFVERVFGHQDLAAELRDLSKAYSPPKGRTLIAVLDGDVVGSVAYRRLGDGSCEMKRLIVSERAKGLGVGRRLALAIVDAAREDGFVLMRLDTGNLFAEAIALYESMGFVRCAPHHDYPPELMPFLVFMERRLA